MGTELNEIIKRLPPARRKRVEEHAKELIAEEMRLREAHTEGTHYVQSQTQSADSTAKPYPLQRRGA